MVRASRLLALWMNILGDKMLQGVNFYLFWSINHLHYLCEPANAWEEGDEIVLYSCRMAEINLAMAMDKVKPGNYAKPHL